MNGDRELDVVVFGATGFVGRLVAEYLAENAPDGAKIGLGGRSEDKLRKVRSEIGGRAADWPLVTADSSDAASVAAMAGRTRVVCTTVGPYRKYGMPLVDACIDAGTDYCDLTGEVLFVAETIERHDRAAASGARIVHSVGFDSIPTDLGVFLLHERAREDGAGELGETTLVVTGMKGGASGGTLASMKGQIDEVTASKAARRKFGDAYALADPPAGADPKAEGDRRGVTRDEKLGQWVGPFVMATYNTRIVRRSNALQDFAYGTGFRYQEVMGVGNGPLAPAKGAALAGGLVALAGGLALKPTRMLLDRVLPDPGEGPGEEARRKGFFKLEVHTTTSSGARYVANVSMQGDPGYAATSVMMGESALCLALDRDRLPERAGILTPAAAMDGALVERLRAAGATLEVEKR